MEKTKETKKSQGITLIALVITIIVLLILAGVSIATLTGNNGILTQSKLAKENTALAKEEEEKRLAKNNEYINEQIQNAVPGKMVTETKKDNYVDSEGNKATIPEGFTVDETEKTISKGLVVHGPDKVNGDNGSEFVWIPVPDINNMAQCSTAGGDCNLQLNGGNLKCITHDNEEIVGKLYSATKYNEETNRDDYYANTTYDPDGGYREPAITSKYDNNSSYNNNLFTLEDLKNDYKNMVTSVAKYGGFFVGRYETSLSNATETEAKDGEVQSKAGVIPTAANNSATYRWYGLYNKQNKTYTGTNNSVESSMIWGSQYDRILNWVKEGTNEEEKAKLNAAPLGNQYDPKNSTGIREIATTGNSNYSDDSIKNIKDLGGNLEEWTLEACFAFDRVLRGGSPGSCTFIWNRHNYGGTVNADWNRGSRLALYIK